MTIMTKQLLNEAELLLLRKWDEARLLEQSMERVREKYAALFEKVAEAVTAGHPELDAHKIYPTQFWATGAIGFGRKTWPEGESYNLPGLWMDNLRLEVLAAEDHPPPIAGIWLSPKALKKTSLTMAKMRQEITKEAPSLLAQDEYERHIRPGADAKYALNFAAPTKKEILGMIAAGEGEKFVDTIVDQFDLMARFVPVLDRLFSSAN